MPFLNIDCPRCGAKSMTVDVPYSVAVGKIDWRIEWELFAICRKCSKTLILRAQTADTQAGKFGSSSPGFTLHGSVKHSLDQYVELLGPLTLGDYMTTGIPEHLPQQIHVAYREAVTSLAAGCPNAAGAMFRLVLDLATKERIEKLPEEKQPNAEVRGNLAKRLFWLFENDHLPQRLRSLAKAVRENANDGAHDGTLTELDAEDLHDFSEALMYEIYTVAGKVGAIEVRRAQRRAS